MTTDDAGDSLPALPREVNDRLFELLFGDPARRERAFAELLAHRPDLAAALEAHWQHHLRREQQGAPSRAGEDDSFPGYRLLAVLGEGGMGMVYRAEQRDPHRLVALKVIKQGMDSKAVLARFEQERQALAAMDHDAIAKVFDCGTSSRGQPYFAMELVDGLPIHRYCDAHRLSLRARIELFAQVCQGVQHAHQKGVIHRDLKPGNVLVAEQEGHHAVKIIDFGVARAIDRRLHDGSFCTEYGAIVGTPEYMSPEQAAGDLRRIDTRTDIYALGVILYELLVGALPFPSAELRAAGMAEIGRRLRDDEPPKPSTRLSTLGPEGTTCAALRQLSVERLRRELAGDLDWVVLKAMAKEPERRYESATALAEDLGRYLLHEPVHAGPPSGWYRMRKLLRRRRALVLGASAVLVTLVGGGVGTFVQYLRAEEKAVYAGQQQRQAERRAAELAQVLAFQESQWSEVDSARMGAHLRRAMLAATKEELRPDLEDCLQGVNFTALALGMLQEDVFDRALASIRSGFAAEPLIQARLLGSVVLTRLELGLLAGLTEPLTEVLDLRRSLQGEDHRDTLNWYNNLGMLLLEQGRPAEAEPFLRRALAGLEELLGPDHPETLTSTNNLGLLLQAQGKLAAAEPYFRDALARRRRVLGDDHVMTLSSVSNLGTLLRVLARYPEAEPLYHEALAGHRRRLGDDHSETLNSLHGMGALLQEQGKHVEAEPWCLEALAKRRQFLGDDHADTLKSILTLAMQKSGVGRYAEAEPLYVEAMQRSRRVLGDDHPDTLAAISSMGSQLGDRGELAAAEPFHREALVGRRRTLGDDHPDTLASINNLAALLQRRGENTEAEALLRELLASSRRTLGDAHRTTLTAMNNLAMLLHGTGRAAEAEPLVRECVERRRVVLGDEHPDTLVALNNLGLILHALGKPAEAGQCWREVLEKVRRSLGEDHPHVLNPLVNLGYLYLGEGKLAEAEPVLREALEKCRKIVGDDHPYTLGALGAMTALLRAQGKYAESTVYCREALAGERRVLGDDHLHTLTSIFNLGYLLRAQGKPAEAEPYFREALAGFRRTCGDEHARTLAALQGLASLLTDGGCHAEAVALLSAGEAAARRVYAGDPGLQLAPFLVALGEAHTGLPGTEHLAAAEAKLLEAQAMLAPAGGTMPRSATGCVRALVRLYGAWHAAEPRRGHDREAAAWRAMLTAGAAPPR